MNVEIVEINCYNKILSCRLAEHIANKFIVLYNAIKEILRMLETETAGRCSSLFLCNRQVGLYMEQTYTQDVKYKIKQECE